MHKPVPHPFGVNTNLSLLTIVTTLAEIAPSLHAHGGVERLLDGDDSRFRIYNPSKDVTTITFLNGMTKDRFVDLLEKKFNPKAVF